jgi:single-stranded-DNA-specific exonuclease
MTDARTQRRWSLMDPHPAAPELARSLRTSPLVAQVLLNRGVSEPEKGREYLQPSLKLLHEPATIPGLSEAAHRIASAIRSREPIVIYGDYDVDGITACAILWHAIHRLGGTARCYVPHRIEEGYGLNSEAIAQLCAGGARLIVTVDCGVTACEPAEVAGRAGVDLIITDHHDFRADGQMPRCRALVHPRLGQDEESARNPHLCGAGVAFKLAWGVGQVLSGGGRVPEDFKAFLIDALALAALGTIADVVPLVGENRVIARFGLGGLRATSLSGLRALIQSAGLDGMKVDSYDVGFKLGPRLNACGRMGHARLAVEMLTDAPADRAREIATYLEQQNRARQALERKIVAQAMAQCSELGYDRPDAPAAVLAGEQWHPGVIGIVASRVVDRIHKPVVMLSLQGDSAAGSARSVPGFHLARALEACASHLQSHGGHEMAAGLKLPTRHVPEFRESFMAHATRTITPEMLIPELRLDCVAELKEVTHSVVRDLQRLGPFGQGNRRPLLCCRDLTLASPPRRVGKTGDHLQLYVRQGGQSMKCIAFNHGRWFDQLREGMRIDLAAEPVLNEYNGYSSVELEVKDVRVA